MPLSQVLEDLSHSSPVTLVYLTILGGAVAVVVSLQLVRTLRYIAAVTARFLPARQPQQRSQQKQRKQRAAAPASSSSVATHTQQQAPAKAPPPKPGKSIKQLLKENRQSAARAHAHEQLPDSDFFLTSLKGHDGTVVSVDISQDQTSIMTACKDDVVRVYSMRGDFANAKPQLTRLKLPGTPLAAGFWASSGSSAPVAGACVESATQIGTTDYVTAKSGAGGRVEVDTVAAQLHGRDAARVACTAPVSGGAQREPVLASMTKTKEVAVFIGRREVARVNPNGIENYQVRLSRDGRFLAAATWGSDVKVWELLFSRDGAFNRCDKVMDLKGHTKGVTSVAFNQDSTRMVTASKDGFLALWRIDVRYNLSEDPKCLKRCKLQQEPYAHLAWACNDVIVGAVGSDVHLISAENGSVRKVIKDAHSGKAITCLVASGAPVRCGDMTEAAVVTGGQDSRARVWVVPQS